MSNNIEMNKRPPRIFRFLRKADGTRINQDQFRLIRWPKINKTRGPPPFEMLERRIL